jgi:transcriptional regulator with XRE-family HTH domain
VIRLTRDGNLGRLLRRLRHEAHLTADQLAERANVSRAGLYKREASSGGATVAGLIDHFDALGYDLVAVPRDRSTT